MKEGPAPSPEAFVETSAPSPVIADAPVHAPRPPKPEQRHENRPRQHDKPQQDRPKGEQRQEHRQEHRKDNRAPRETQRQHNERAAQPEAVDKSQLPAFLFRPVPVKKQET
jgi:hypothetical protein